MSAASTIRLDHVSKVFPRHRHLIWGLKQALLHLPSLLRKMRTDRFLALQDVCLDVGLGETIGVIGANGSGKSTLLGVIAGVIRPETGIVEVHGRVAPLLELGAGFHPDLTGRENIELNGVLMGLTRREVTERMEAIVAFSGLTRSLHEPIRTYSSGMVARLGFSVAVHLEPDILLIDEILAVGDNHFQTRCLERLAEFRRKGVTIVLVSHSLSEVRLLCDRVVWLEAGRIVMQGKPDEVVTAYERS
jgi:lipopolysaccharide transport system ATP-binding protein